jgi:hypothetical protein
MERELGTLSGDGDRRTTDGQQDLELSLPRDLAE